MLLLEGKLLAASLDGGLYVLDPRDGSLKERKALPEKRLMIQMAVDGSNVAVTVGNTLSFLRGGDLSEAWTTTLPDDDSSTTTPGHQYVFDYIACERGRTYALRGARFGGRNDCLLRFDNTSGKYEKIFEHPISPLYAPFCVKDGVVFLRANREILAVSADNGSTLWKRPLPELEGELLLVGKNLYVTSLKEVFILDAKDGSVGSTLQGLAMPTYVIGNQTVVLVSSRQLELMAIQTQK